MDEGGWNDLPGSRDFKKTSQIRAFTSTILACFHTFINVIISTSLFRSTTERSWQVFKVSVYFSRYIFNPHGVRNADVMYFISFIGQEESQICTTDNPFPSSDLIFCYPVLKGGIRKLFPKLLQETDIFCSMSVGYLRFISPFGNSLCKQLEN